MMDQDRLAKLKQGLARKNEEIRRAENRRMADAKARQQRIDDIEFAYGEQQPVFRSVASALADELRSQDFHLDHDVLHRPDGHTFGTYTATLNYAGGRRAALSLIARFTTEGILAIAIGRPSVQTLAGGNYHAGELGRAFWEDWLMRLVEAEIGK